MPEKTALEIEMTRAVEVMQSNFEKYREKVDILNTTCETALQIAETRDKKATEMKLILLKVKDLLEGGDSAQALNYLKIHNIKDL